MKNLLKISLLVCLAIVTLVSCNDDDTWDEYEEWRNANNIWLSQQIDRTDADGTSYYDIVIPSWNKQAFVLMKYFNDTNITKQNLRPLSTSTVDVKYIGRLYNDEAFDSSYLNTSPADSIYRTSLQSSIIDGWKIALQYMHIGDSVEVIIPYDLGYGEYGSGSIDPYSVLKFNIKLVDIPYYETSGN